MDLEYDAAGGLHDSSDRIKITGPRDIWEPARVIYDELDDDQEHFVVLLCNAINEVLAFKVIASGAHDQVAVDPRLVFRSALVLGACHIIAIHNHPTETLMPSQADIDLTVRLIAGGRIVNVTLIDHIIYGTGGYVSMANQYPELFATAGKAG